MTIIITWLSYLPSTKKTHHKTHPHPSIPINYLPLPICAIFTHHHAPFAVYHLPPPLCLPNSSHNSIHVTHINRPPGHLAPPISNCPLPITHYSLTTTHHPIPNIRHPLLTSIKCFQCMTTGHSPTPNIPTVHRPPPNTLNYNFLLTS